MPDLTSEYMERGVCFNCGDHVPYGGFICATCNMELTAEVHYERSREDLADMQPIDMDVLYPERQPVKA